MIWVKLALVAGVVNALINLPMKRTSGIVKRDTEYVDVDTDYSEDLWTVIAEVGSPKQSVEFSITFWGNYSVLMPADNCSSYLNSQGFNVNLLDTFYVIQDYFIGTSLYDARDSISLGNLTTNMEFVAMSECFRQGSMLNLGYISNTTTKQPMDNIAQRFKKSGLIESSVISLWNPELYSVNGSLIFGGIDQSKYVGTLQKLPTFRSEAMSIPPINGNNIAFRMDGLKVNGSKIHNEPLPATINDRTYLPFSYWQAISDAFGVPYEEGQYGVYYFNESAFPLVNVTLDFGGIGIDIPLDVLLASSLTGTYSNAYILLGTDIWTYVYTAIDYDNKEIALAQAVTDFEGDAEIVTATSGIPSAINAPTYATLEESLTGKSLSGNGLSSKHSSTRLSGANTKEGFVTICASLIAGFGLLFI